MSAAMILVAFMLGGSAGSAATLWLLTRLAGVPFWPVLSSLMAGLEDGTITLDRPPRSDRP